jgi:hypothetical protein
VPPPHRRRRPHPTRQHTHTHAHKKTADADRLSLHIGETTLTLPFTPQQGAELEAALNALLATFADKAKAERPRRWPMMEVAWKGGGGAEPELLELVCNPNAYRYIYVSVWVWFRSFRAGERVCACAAHSYLRIQPCCATRLCVPTTTAYAKDHACGRLPVLTLLHNATNDDHPLPPPNQNSSPFDAKLLVTLRSGAPSHVTVTTEARLSDVRADLEALRAAQR